MGVLYTADSVFPIIRLDFWSYIFYISVGLSALLVSINWAMRRPYIVERVTDWLHVFQFCVGDNYFLYQAWSFLTLFIAMSHIGFSKD